jgi:hypothetical protein
MTNRIIKSYTGWLLESLSLNEAIDQATIQEMAKNQDLEGLYKILIANDDEVSKALPNYLSVMEWWKRGGADLNLWKSLVKTGGSAKSDRANSAKSMYFWMGGFIAGNKQTATNASKYNYISSVESLVNAIPATAATISAINPNDAKFKQDNTSKTNLTNLITGWKNAAAIAAEVSNFVKVVKGKGLNLNQASLDMIVPSNSISGYFILDGAQVPYADYLKKYAEYVAANGKINGFANSVYGTSIATWLTRAGQLTLDKVKANIQTLTASLNDQATISQYFTANNTMTPANKKIIMEAIDAKVKDHIARVAKSAKPGTPELTADQAIKLATNLSIVPKGSAITVQPSDTPAAPVSTTLNGTFPEANGDWNSDGLKKSVNYFPDDSIDIKPEMQTELNTAVKNAVDLITKDGGKITAVRVWGTSSTSIVPSSYDKATKKPAGKDWTTQKNVDLSLDRLASLKTALTSAFTTAGVDAAIIKPADANSQTLPNNGDPAVKWNKEQYANRANDPKLLADYNDKFGKYRYAFGHFEIDFTKTTTTVEPTTPIATTSSNWDVRIGWADESISIKLPPIPGLGTSTGKKAPGRTKVMGCPKF